MKSSRLFIFLSVFMVAALLASCAQSTPKGPLIVLDWSGYEQEVFWAKYKEKHPDQPPEFTFFADDAEAFAKLQSGFVADLVHPHVGWLELYVQNDLLEPIDTSKLSNFSALMPELVRLGQVNGKQYLIPWEWGYDSITVRTDLVQEIPDSWADLWDPQYKGKVSVIDSAESLVVVTAVVLGFDPYSMNSDQLEQVKQKLIELKPNLLGYWTDYTEINQQLASGEVWVAGFTWPDAYVAVKAEGLLVEYITPKEGRLGWVYGYSIVKSGNNPDLAHDYIDAVIDVDAMTEMAMQYAYGASNSAVVNALDPETVALMQLDQPDLMSRTIFLRSITEEQRQTWTALWDEVKAAP